MGDDQEFQREGHHTAQATSRGLPQQSNISVKRFPLTCNTHTQKTSSHRSESTVCASYAWQRGI
eukprot:3233646-Amphidinium_carterae.2